MRRCCSLNRRKESNPLSSKMFKCLPNPFCTRSIDYIDKRHSNLFSVPDEIFKHSKTLEELFLDSNQLRILPRNIYKLTQLRRLTFSDNEIESISPEIANLTLLEELNCSRNELNSLPDQICYLDNLQILYLSGNPLQNGLPLGIVALCNLKQLTVNDCSLAQLPENIGKLTNLEIIEARENLLRTIPKSINELTNLQTLDLGNNEICQLPQNLNALVNLKELWLDTNVITDLPQHIGELRSLQCIDLSSNRVSFLSDCFCNLSNLSHVELGWNRLRELPEQIGKLEKLVVLKLNKNHLSFLPESIGRCKSMTELILSDNLIKTLPSSIGKLTMLNNLNVDKNLLQDIPDTIIGCQSLGILSLRYNRLRYLSNSLGELNNLKVLDVTGNLLRNVPRTLINSSVKAIWLSENQAQPMLTFQEDIDEVTGLSVLTCYLLPQQQYSTPSSERIKHNLNNSSSLSDNSPSSFKNGVVKFVEDNLIVKDRCEDNSEKLTIPKDCRTWKRRNVVARNSVDVEFDHQRDLIRESIASFADFDYICAVQPRTSDDYTVRVNDCISANYSEYSSDEFSKTDFLSLSKQDIVIKKSSRSDLDFNLKLNEVKIERELTSFNIIFLCQLTEFSVLKIFIAQYNRKDGKLNKGDEIVELDGMIVSTMDEKHLAQCIFNNSSNQMSLTILKHKTPIVHSLKSSSIDSILEKFKVYNFVVTEVCMQKDFESDPLGLSIVGGIDQPCYPFDCSHSGIFVFKVQENGIAHKSGVCVGNCILMANGVDLTDASHERAVGVLTQPSKYLIVLLLREPAPEGIKEITIYRQITGTPLGLKLNGGIDGTRANPLNNDDRGIFITEIVSGGLADIDNRIKIGMRLLAINGHSVMGCRLDEARDFLANNAHLSTLTLTVCNGFYTNDDSCIQKQKSECHYDKNKQRKSNVKSKTEFFENRYPESTGDETMLSIRTTSHSKNEQKDDESNVIPSTWFNPYNLNY